MATAISNPYAPPTEVYSSETELGGLLGSDQAWRDGKLLVVSPTSALTDVCLVDNCPADGRFVRCTFSWTRPAFLMLGLVLLIGLPPLGIVFAVLGGPFVNHRTSIRIPVSPARYQRHQWRQKILNLSVLMCLVLCCGMFVALAVEREQLAIPMVLAGFAVLLVGWLISRLVGWNLKAARVHRQHVWIKGVHPQYLAALPELDRRQKRLR